MDYRLLISMDVLEFIERLPPGIRRQLRTKIAAIGSDPLKYSDAEDYDEIGRLMHIAVVGDFSLMYWIDDADQHVKILDIHSADR